MQKPPGVTAETNSENFGREIGFGDAGFGAEKTGCFVESGEASERKTKSKLVQTEGEEQSVPKADGEKNGMPSASSEVECLSRRCKDLENKLEDVRREKLTVEREKTSLLLSLDWNIEQKDALEEQLTTLQGKVNGQKASNETCAVFTQTNDSSDAVEKPLSQTDGGFRASYKGISEAKVRMNVPLSLLLYSVNNMLSYDSL